MSRSLQIRSFGLGTGLAGVRRDHVGVRRTWRVTLTLNDGSTVERDIETHFRDMAISLAKANRRDVISAEAVQL